MAPVPLTCSLALGPRDSPDHSPAWLSAPANTCRRNSPPVSFSVWTPQHLPGHSPSPQSSTALPNKVRRMLVIFAYSLQQLPHLYLCFGNSSPVLSLSCLCDSVSWEKDEINLPFLWNFPSVESAFGSAFSIQPYTYVVFLLICP